MTKLNRIFIALTVLLLSTFAFAGGDGFADKVIQPTPTVTLSPYNNTEFNVSLLGTGLWTQTTSYNDRYFGVDHAFGGTLAANYFFMKYFGVGISGSGYDVKNVSTPARVATSNDQRRFVGNALLNVTFRYPIGTTPFAPYARIGAGGLFNGGNSMLHEPNCSAECTLLFEKVDHDAKGMEEGAIGVEYRINHTFGIITEGAFDKVNRPHSNFATIRAGVNVAF